MIKPNLSQKITRDGGLWLSTADIISPSLQRCIVRKEELRCRALWQGQLVLRRPAAGGEMPLALSRSSWRLRACGRSDCLFKSGVITHPRAPQDPVKDND